jgi:hypothetical protein
MTPQELRSLARKCRKWVKSSIDPDNITLFKIWAIELADEADEIEYRSCYRQRAAIICGTGRTVSTRKVK